jgi:hypothetical protein
VDSKPKVELFSLVGYVCTRHGYWDLRRGREGQLKNRPRGRVRLYKAPYPSIPVRFWGDDARGGKFLKAYHDMYPDVWCHGDFIVMNPHTKGYIIHGRRSASASSLLACAHVLTLIFQRRSVETPGACTLVRERSTAFWNAPCFLTHRLYDMRRPAPAAGQRRTCAAVHQDACGA